MTTSDLDAIGRRIEILTVDPLSIRSPLTRLARPFLFRIGWRPNVRVDRALALVRAVSSQDASTSPVDLAKLAEAAVRELRDNVTRIERATVVAQRPLTAHAAWLRRLYEMVIVAQRAALEAEATDAGLAVTTDSSALLPPLVLLDARERDDEVSPADAEGPDPSRVLDVQLDAVDHILTLAREETRRMGRRRRLLESARQLLLETSAALPLDADGVEARAQSVARGMTRINRLQALGIQTDVDLLHQARTALVRGERERLWATLQGMRAVAREAGDPVAAALADQALSAIEGDASPEVEGDAERARSAVNSISRSAAEVFGARVVDAVHRGYAAARERADKLDESGEISQLLRDFLAPGAERATLAHALAVDGCFEVGGALSPVRVHESAIERTEVDFPTPELLLKPARGPADIVTAVIGDPRAIVLDLAAGRLLHRRFVREERVVRARTELQGELRIYVLDGSESMIGLRARMRDAVLIAELATLIQRLERPQPATRVSVQYRYFTHRLGPVATVREVDEAIRAISRVVATRRTGGTDIEGALLASLERVREARLEDAALSRAQIVLVTDGKAPVSPDRVDEALARVGEVSVGVSVIALGQENPALRRLVARQRRRGVRAFYHFMSDAHLETLADGNIDEGVAVHLPPVRSRTRAELAADVEPLLDQLAALERTRSSAALASLDEADRHRRLGGDSGAVDGEGQRARLESRLLDRGAISRRFHRWFPPPASRPGMAAPKPEPGSAERDDLETVLVLMAAIVEVLEVASASPHEREADAVDLLERLLPNARLSPARYLEVLAVFGDETGPALSAIHAAARRGAMWRLGESSSGDAKGYLR